MWEKQFVQRNIQYIHVRILLNLISTLVDWTDKCARYPFQPCGASQAQETRTCHLHTKALFILLLLYFAGTRISRGQWPRRKTVVARGWRGAAVQRLIQSLLRQVWRWAASSSCLLLHSYYRRDWRAPSWCVLGNVHAHLWECWLGSTLWRWRYSFYFASFFCWFTDAAHSVTMSSPLTTHSIL